MVNLYSFRPSPETSKVLAPFKMIEGSSGSNYHVILNLYPVFNQFLIGSIWMKLFLAFMERSMV